jgi:hypothetical protein
MNNDKCKASVRGEGWGWLYQRGCQRNAWKDGYCKQHHPDSVKARREESNRYYRQKMDNSPLSRAYKQIEILKEEIERLKKEAPHDPHP